MLGDLKLLGDRANLLISAEPVAEPVLEALRPPPHTKSGCHRSYAPDSAEANWYADFALKYPANALKWGAFAKVSYGKAYRSYIGIFKGANQARHQRRLRAGSGEQPSVPLSSVNS